MISGDSSVDMSKPPRSTKKKDPFPRGLFRHPSSTASKTIYGVRFTCGAGHIHEEQAGPIKSDAVRVYHNRRKRAHDETGWCPRQERRTARELLRAEETRELARITFEKYAEDYLGWAEANKRSWTTDRSMLKRRIEPEFGDRMLDEITIGDIERFRDRLLGEVARSTVNRYTAILSGMFNRAIKHGHIIQNPVKGLSRFKEAGQRIAWLSADEEAAVQEALPAHLRPLFTVSIHTGLRWSEQVALRWRDIDILAGTITVSRSKNGDVRIVPMNSVVRSVVVDLASKRRHPANPDEPVFACPHKQADKFFPRAVEAAQEALREAGKDAAGLDGYTWHCNRHTFASRLVMAAVDIRTVQELGGWRTLGQVLRYAHVAREHLYAAVERLVAPGCSEPTPATELGENLDSAQEQSAGVS